ncbi:MAG: DNA polymerase I, partial [Spirochaetes bacterium]|nr:DNA polymerase I [Spirochaetota bacterium]
SSDIISFDKEAVYEKFGINPDQVADYLSIVGDASDNVPGVKGIGKKGAEKLLNNYVNLDEIYSSIDEIKPDGIRNKLRDSKDSAYLSRDLVLLNREMDLPIDESGWVFNGLNSDAAMERLLELELKILVSDPLLKTAGQAVPVKEAAPLKYHLVNTESDLDMLISKLKKCDKFAVDTETTSLDTLEAELLGISFSFEEGIGYYLPVGHSQTGIDSDAALKRIEVFLADPSIGKIGQNLKFDASVFASRDISFKGIIFDSMIAAYLLSPGLGRYKLEELALRYLGREMIHYSDLVDDKEKTLFDVPIEKVAEYAAEDAEVALCLYNKLMPMLQEAGMKKLFEEIEVPLIEVLSDIQRQGIAIDNGHFKSLSILLEDKIKKLESDIYAEAGEEFNINSPKQLSVILFEKKGIEPIKKTKTGFSTDEGVLDELSKEHRIASLLLDFRKNFKLKSTYVDVMPKLRHEKTGRVHTSLNQTVAATGRLASSSPNLQNIPVRDDIGREVRKGFIPAKENKLLSADYSQIELRVLAALSGDEVLTGAYRDGLDIHNKTASAIFSIDEQNVDRDHRALAKAVNFGVIYGQTAYGLSKELKISRQEAQNFIDAYFSLYSGVNDYIKELLEEAHETGYVTTYYGRIRKIPELSSSNRMTKSYGERMAVNTVIQGTAADLIKIAMINVFNALNNENLKSRMILQVHDELLFEVPDSETEQVKKIVEDEMKKPWPFDIPIEVSLGFGDNWDEAH